MRLKRVDALRYGALESACLTDLGDGLTVVLGPNECGKSTYTALVRHVLFGFPMGKGKAGERFYKPAAGDRAARLVFEDESGEWSVERVEGKRGGDVTVAALRGAERPDLLAELVGDLTEQSYRVVFGFGLDEMAAIESGDGTLGARLYAAGTGLDTSPLDVREALRKSAEGLFTPRARVGSQVNAGLGRVNDLRDRIRALEVQASSYAEDQVRAAHLADELEPLRACRDETEARLRALERDAQRVRDLTDSISGLSADRDEIARRIAALERSAAEAAPDERVLAVAPELGALLEEQSGFQQRMDSLRGLEASLAAARARLETRAGLPDPASDSVENRAQVDAWASRRAALEGEIRAAEGQAARSEARAREFATSASGGESAPPKRWLWPGAALGVGLVFAAAGAAVGQWLAAGLGALVAVAAAVWLLARPRMSADDLGADASRSAAEARAARAVAEGASETLEREEASWREWTAARSLDVHGSDPAAVRVLLDELRERSSFTAEVTRLQGEVSRERAAASAWAGRLSSLCAAFLGSSDELALDDVSATAARARDALDTACALADRRARSLEERQDRTAEIQGLDAKLAAQRESLSALVGAHGSSQDSATVGLDALVAVEAGALEDLRRQVDERSEELSIMRGRLDTEGRDSAMAMARQELEGLLADVRSAAERHVVDALATRLLDRAIERFERKRKPEVTRVAAEVFGEMTGGRYTDVRVPLGGDGIRVVTSSRGVKVTSELSRGTAEQLYLAMRVGYLSSLDTGLALPVLMDDVVVNFDTERRAGAAIAIARLAEKRQVVFFTCHEETAAVLATAAPGRTEIRLERCELRG
jgi:uncharacterized protein YhaN